MRGKERMEGEGGEKEEKEEQEKKNKKEKPTLLFFSYEDRT